MDSLGFIHTYTGKHFYPLQPDPALIDLRDVAHSLSMQARFSGMTRDFYSVAEHCVRVSMVCSRQDALWGLLHDAAEAYLSDVPKPAEMDAPSFEAVRTKALFIDTKDALDPAQQ